MNGADFERNEEDDAIWDDIQELFDDQPFDIANIFSESHSLEFVVPVASGFRFRYQSEIDKKSYSCLKGEKNKPPMIKIFSPCDVALRLELVTQDSTGNLILSHFNTLYEVGKLAKHTVKFQNGICTIPFLKGNSFHDLKLDFLGVRKWKLKEAIPRIRELYPNITDGDAKQFFNKNKETVKLRASLIEGKYIAVDMISTTIKSQIAKENKDIRIQHISPKTVADNGETLIIILEKKITSESCTSLIYDNNMSTKLKPAYEDGQTFVFRLPDYNLQNPSMARIRIQCSDNYDEKPIRFLQQTSELRKRKSPHYESDVPLKKPTNYDSPRQLYPESGNVDACIEIDGLQQLNSSVDSNIEFDGHAPANNSLGEIVPLSSECQNNLSDVDDNIEYDGPQSMEIGEAAATLPTLSQDHISCNGSSKDSGIHSDDKSSSICDSDYDEDRSYQGTDDESDEIEVEGNRRRPCNNMENLEPINFPPAKRAVDSRLEPNRKDQVASKIFSEVARIGHDFAFGKQPSDLFSRIEKQLPVVFTLQDDVGDTPLNNAILKGNVAPAERILKVVHDECKWALDLVNTSGHTALILAPACEVPADFIAKLLDAGCRLDIWDDLGKSAITYAIEYKNTNALRVLLDFIQKHGMKEMLQRPEKVYYSPLQIAVMNSYLDGVKMLTELKDINGKYMVDINELALMNKDTALHIAVERESGVDIIKLLLDRKDLDINHQKDNKSTALNTATKLNLTEVAALLKSHRADEVMMDSEIQESADDMEEEEDVSSSVMFDMCPLVEMTPEDDGPAQAIITTLTTKMESMSLKGENKSKLIMLLLTGEVFLSVEELSEIVRPAYKSLFNKYGNTRQHMAEIEDMLDRFNCLPNSLGQLVEKLHVINRTDMVSKIAEHFSGG